MELDLGAELAEFREEIRQLVAESAPKDLSSVADWNLNVVPGGYGRPAMAEAMQHPSYKHWEGVLLERRLVCPHWPVEYGGAGLDAVRVAILNEEFHRAGVPRVVRGMGESLVGPSIIMHGTPEQKDWFLPRIISGDDRYCQGFSEPNAGSDLAAVETRGVVHGDEIVVTGQKLWTSGAIRANMMFCLCRTDPDTRKYDGLSYVLLDLADPGFELRPIRQMSGAADFYEEHIDGVRAPLFNVIGGLNNGWRVAMTTLGHERGGKASVEHLGFQREFWELVERARKNGTTSDPLVRQRMAWAFTHVELMRFNGVRTLERLAKGLPPGPESSVAKLFKTEYHKRLGELAMAIEGAAGLVRPSGDEYPTGQWQNVFLASRAGTIYSGSSEIQRNIISEHSLGMPR